MQKPATLRLDAAPSAAVYVLRGCGYQQAPEFDLAPWSSKFDLMHRIT